MGISCPCFWFPLDDSVPGYLSVLSKDADVDEDMAEMIASEIESLSEQLKVYEEKLKVYFSEFDFNICLISS